ncbi:uncharacterized protein LOC143784182 [Ranitomeya variabilis]|uniref:uncharacterized protein LOC143784182 n=1 Tax=Ranitomeya variabilis TaxID=490064 RepID=UPI0040574043
MDPDQLRKSILNFSLDHQGFLSTLWKLSGFTSRGDQGYSRVLLQIFGYIGHGKSSFINSCKYVMEEGEEFIECAIAGEDHKTMTMERKAYALTKNITIVDNRGCIIMGSFQRAEIYAQLGNFLPIGEKVEWMKDYTDLMYKLEDAALNPNYSDFIVPILIYSAKCRFGEGEKQELQELLNNCVKMTGVFPIIVITNKTSGDFMEAEKMFKQMGAEDIISIENYTKKDHIKTRGKTNDILKVIHSALENVKYRLEAKERNPQKDWVQRKKFMLEYIHKAEMEKKQDEMRREEAMRRAEEKKREEQKRRQEARNMAPVKPFMRDNEHNAEMKKRQDELSGKEEPKTEKGNDSGGGLWSWLFGRKH